MTSHPYVKRQKPTENARTIMAKLLQHGPLSRGEAITQTGWDPRRCDKAIEGLLAANEVRGVNIDGKRRYALTNTARVRAQEVPDA